MEKVMQTKRQLPNRFIYATFLVMFIIFICLRDYSSAIIFGGIGLVFDPFNQSVSFDKRPAYQKIWLVTHLLLVFIVLFISIAH